MFALEVLQRCPAQRKDLVQAIGVVDFADASLLYFDPKNSESCLPHNIALQISVGCLGKNVHRTVLDEGASTYIMSYSCWKALGSPTLAALQTVLKAFDGHLFTPHGILAAFPIEFGGKIATTEVEVMNASIDYSLLLRRSWFYPMQVVTSTINQLVCFPHQGKIISIDQLDYYTPSVCFDTVANIPLVSNSHQVTELIGAGLFKDPCLMGVFPPPIPDAFVALINMISSIGTLMGDPFVLPNMTEVETFGDTMPLSPAENIYFVIQFKSNLPFVFHKKMN
jgi:hypothetical protein